MYKRVQFCTENGVTLNYIPPELYRKQPENANQVRTVIFRYRSRDSEAVPASVFIINSIFAARQIILMAGAVSVSMTGLASRSVRVLLLRFPAEPLLHLKLFFLCEPHSQLGSAPERIFCGDHPLVLYQIAQLGLIEVMAE